MALIINAASFAISFATIWLVRPSERMPGAGASAPGRGRYWHEFGAGLRFFVTSRILVAVLVGLCITVLGAAAINALNIFFLQVGRAITPRHHPRIARRPCAGTGRPRSAS